MSKKIWLKVGTLTVLASFFFFLYQTNQEQDKGDQKYIHANEQIQEGTIIVGGTGTVTVKPDLAYVRFGAEEIHNSAEQAQQAVGKRMEEIRGKLTKLGIEDKQIETVRFHVQPHYGPHNQNEQKKQFRAQHILEVEYEKIDQVGSLLDEMSNAGANVIEHTRFTLKDQTDAEKQAIQKAVQHAKTKANTMATAVGKKRGEVLQIVDSQAQIGVQYQEYATKESADFAGETVIEAGEIEVVQNVDIVYDLIN